jgi:hypothetical protein
MTPAAKKNIAATFEANPHLQTLFANEHGHCFTKAGQGLTAVTRGDLDKAEEPAAAAPEDKKPEDKKKKK